MLIHNKKKGLLLKIVNGLIGTIYFPWSLFSKKTDLSGIRPARILMLRLDHIGDVIMTSPSFTALRDRFPQAEILLLTDTAGAQLFSKDPRIDKVLVYNWPWVHQKKNNHFTSDKVKELFKLIMHLRKEKIDILIDFRGDLRFILLFGVLTGAKIRISNSRCGESRLLHSTSGYDVSKHEVERSLDVLDCFTGIKHGGRPAISLGEEELNMVKSLVSEKTGKPFPPRLALIAPYSSKDVKSWPVHYFQEVITHLVALGFSVIVAGTEDDQEHALTLIRNIPGDVYSFAGKTSVRELAALLSVSDIVVGVDTGVLHIASCFEVPVIALFGATRSVEFRPYSPMATIIETNTCQCNQFLHDKCEFPVNGYAKCLAELTPARVIESINQIIPKQLITD